MSRTFEERTSEELDALYQGALFLAGGDEVGAEHLLVDAVALAFEEHVRETEIASVERWLEARLVRSFLRRVTEALPPVPEALADRAALEPETFERVGARELFAAAAALPAWPRAALWLVLLRRWGYQEAADVLGIEREQLPLLLGYRDVMIQEMLRTTRRGAQGTGTRGQ